MVLITLLHGDHLVFLQGWELSLGNYVMLCCIVSIKCENRS